MKRARIRHYVLVGLVLLAAASMLPFPGGGSRSKPTGIPTERARYQASARFHHPHIVAPTELQPTDTWAER